MQLDRVWAAIKEKRWAQAIALVVGGVVAIALGQIIGLLLQWLLGEMAPQGDLMAIAILDFLSSETFRVLAVSCMTALLVWLEMRGFRYLLMKDEKDKWLRARAALLGKTGLKPDDREKIEKYNALLNEDKETLHRSIFIYASGMDFHHAREAVSPYVLFWFDIHCAAIQWVTIQRIEGTISFNMKDVYPPPSIPEPINDLRRAETKRLVIRQSVSEFSEPLAQRGLSEVEFGFSSLYVYADGIGSDGKTSYSQRISLPQTLKGVPVAYGFPKGITL